MSWESGLGVFRPSLRGEPCDAAVGATCLCAGCAPMASWGTSLSVCRERLVQRPVQPQPGRRRPSHLHRSPGRTDRVKTRARQNDKNPLSFESW